MKSSLSSGLVALCLMTSSAYALDPVQGVYGGIFLGANHTPPVNLAFTEPTTLTTITGKLNYGHFGDIGGQVGYRFNQFRLEGELFLNQSPYSKVTVGTVQLTNQKNQPGIRLSGHTRTAALMLNGIMDAYSLFEDTCFVPFVGLGVGYANVQNGVKLYYQNVLIPGTDLSSHKNGAAVQFLVGVNYFMDDFTTIGLDFRYFTSKAIPPITSRMQVASLNVSLNGSFDFG